MITDALFAVVDAFVAALLNVFNSILPSPAPPSWLGNVGDVMHTLFAGASSMGAWLPVRFGLTVVTTVLTVKIAGFMIRVVRIVASFATLGGGA